MEKFYKSELLVDGKGGSVRIEIPLPRPFYVITAKNEHNQVLILRDIHNLFASPWTDTVDEYSKRYDDKKEAKEIMKIQTSNFPEQNRNLTSFKVRKIKPVYILE